MISSGEAVLLLNKWFNGKHRLRILFSGPGLRMAFDGIIEDFDEHIFALLPTEPNDSHGEALVDINECSFEYGDSREAPPGSPSALKFSSILTILRPDGTRVMVAEMRSLE